MANHPIPDNAPEIMEKDFGTVVLITDPRSDAYLTRSRKNNPPPDRNSRWCGGQGGFDDYVERWH